MGHFGDESFQSITCTGNDNQTRTTKRQKKTKTPSIIKVAIAKNTKQNRPNTVDRGLTKPGLVAFYDIESRPML